MKKLAAILVSLIFLFLAATNAFAADIKLEPENFLISTTAGQTIREALTVRNLSPTPKNLKLSWEGYSLPEGEFTNHEDLEKHSINFATLSQADLELTPFGTGSIEIEFKLPKNIDPADYYGSLSVNDQNSSTSTEFTIRVLGKTEEKIDIARFYVNNSNLIINIANNGTQTITPNVWLIIESFFGRQAAVKLLNSRELKAGQQTTHKIDIGSLLPGYYQARVSLTYGTGQTKTSFHSFWAYPEFFLATSFLVFILVFIIVLAVILSKRKAHR